ncbi:MAG: DHH family phosphoesterase [Eubacteriales bacterium]|nr:DHH family phosphoesterase [Eubacteriales bacterium]
MLKKLKELLTDHFYWRLLLNIVITMVFFGLYIALSGRENIDRIQLGVIIIIIYAAVIVAISIGRRLASRRFDAVTVSDMGSPLGSITLDVMSRLRQPVLICDESGKIIWYNREITHRVGRRETLYGKNIDIISDISPAEITADGVDIVAFGTTFGVNGYKITAQSKNYLLTLWYDKTELVEAYRRIADETAVVAYIMVDNLEELMQYVQEKYRTASSEIESVLKAWADSVQGILKEYERDRYFFIFDACHLEQFISERFDILDRVRDIRVGESSLPVTVSIGISGSVGSYSEKERAARAALDMGLQRGGDQVVVNTETGMEFYGGRTKTVHKRTKVRARVVANELAVLMSGSSNTLLMGHRNMDFDALGACVGLARLAIFCGVKVNIIANEKDPNLKKCFDKLKNLPEYRNMFVGAIEAQDMLTSETLLVIADVNNKTQFEAPDVAENAFKTVIVDHHRKTAEFKNQPAIAYIEPSASSACELVAEILEQAMPSGNLAKHEADIMFAGILLDTKQFTRNTGTRTFSAALYLRGEGANPADAQTLFKTNLDSIIREAKFTTNVYIYRGLIAIAVNDGDDNTMSDRIAGAKAADKLLTVDGVAASFALCSIEDTVYISARSSGVINVQLIIEKIGGGGHFDAAATQLQGEGMTEALTRLKVTIDEYLKELQ